MEPTISRGQNVVLMKIYLLFGGESYVESQEKPKAALQLLLRQGSGLLLGLDDSF